MKHWQYEALTQMQDKKDPGKGKRGGRGKGKKGKEKKRKRKREKGKKRKGGKKKEGKNMEGPQALPPPGGGAACAAAKRPKGEAKPSWGCEALGSMSDPQQARIFKNAPFFADIYHNLENHVIFMQQSYGISVKIFFLHFLRHSLYKMVQFFHQNRTRIAHSLQALENKHSWSQTLAQCYTLASNFRKPPGFCRTPRNSLFHELTWWRWWCWCWEWCCFWFCTVQASPRP